MAEKTIIAWTERTFNIAWGCTKISPGCKNCYADTLSSRYGHDVWGPTAPRRTFGQKHWDEPKKWNAQAEKDGVRIKVFSSSMCDWAEDHPTISRELEKLWSLIAITPNLEWQLLTKRAERIAELIPDNWEEIKDHVWLGVSIENNDYAWRADYIRHIDSAVRFVSYEPALGPLDKLNLDGIDWVIVGGESGHHFRSMELQWARDLRERCSEDEVSFFWKQGNGIRTEMHTQLDGQTIREYPKGRIPIYLF